jgi:hypothetical protein
MRLVLISLFFGLTAAASTKLQPGEIFPREEQGCIPGFCAPCQAASSGNLAGMALGAALVFGTAWFRRK